MADVKATARNRRFQDLTGQKFGRWTVVECADASGSWKCVCECGNTKNIDRRNLKTGRSKSCGCLNRESLSARMTHGHTTEHSPSIEYTTWVSIIARCENQANHKYGSYGGRGIKVCQRWRESFQAFFEDMGTRPSPKHSIDRIDNDGDYEPGNCKWATRKEQARNRRNNHMLTFSNQVKTLAEWSEVTGIRAATLLNRLKLGWSIEDALTKPLRAKQTIGARPKWKSSQSSP